MVLAGRWGTWEELVLGSAVLRHGTSDWEAVASELRSRTALPHLFTAQVCEVKYNDLQELYSGCDAWFEELRKRRVAELKKELAKTEDSIGSLESKLESLTAEKESDCNNFDYDTSRNQSISPADGVDYMCKDGLSAGSFTSNMVREWMPEREITASVSLQDDGINIQLHDNFMKEMTGNLFSYFGYQSFTKKRGLRKRKIYHIVKEASLGESESTSSAAKIGREESVEQKEPTVDFTGILDSISGDRDVSILSYRIENQAPSQSKKLRRTRPYYKGKTSASKQEIEKGVALGSPVRKRCIGRPPNGCRRGGRVCQVDTSSGKWRRKAST